MQDDIDPVSGQPIPVVEEREQRALAERMVDIYLSPRRTAFAEAADREAQYLDFNDPEHCPSCGAFRGRWPEHPCPAYREEPPL
jgi:hypothetical protein